MDRSVAGFRAAPVLGAAVLVVGVLAAATPSAASPHSPHARGIAVGGNPNSELFAVTVAPKSTDAWALADNQRPSPTTSLDVVLRHHKGKWRRVKITGTPDVPGLQLYGVTAASSKRIWVVGERPTTTDPETTDYAPVIARSTGGAFKTVKIKGVPLGVLFTVSASSPTNAWAIGVTGGYQANLSLHWNGRRWVNVPLPTTADGVFDSSSVVSTSGPKNAWIVSEGNTAQVIEHWNGRRWKVVPLPAGSLHINSIATSGKQTWAVGYTSTTVGSDTVYTPLVLRWSGTAWKTMTLTHAGHNNILVSVTAVGSTAYAVGRNVVDFETSASDVPVSVRLHGKTGAFRRMKLVGKFTSPEAVAASSETVMAVGFYETVGYCQSPFHSVAEILAHATWRQSKIPPRLVPSASTGSGPCA